MPRGTKRPTSALSEPGSPKSVARLLWKPKRVRVSEVTWEDTKEGTTEATTSTEDTEESPEQGAEEYTEEYTEKNDGGYTEEDSEEYAEYWPSWFLDIHTNMTSMEQSFGWWDEGGSSEDEGPEPIEDAELAEEPAEDTEPAKTPNLASNQDLRHGAPAKHARPLKTLDEINLDDAKNRDRWNVQLNNQKIRRSTDPSFEKQVILAQNATKLVSKAYEMLERTPPRERSIVWMKPRYDMYCEEHARLFAKNDDDGEYEQGDARVIKFIRISRQELEGRDIDPDSIPGQSFQADIRICGGLRGTKLFSVCLADTKPIEVDSWSMGVLPFTFIDGYFFKLRLPRDKVLRGTNIDPSKAPEFFDFVGIAQGY
ncbi:unnamed protein product [Clonostachys solani]|uniref:Uncharacterized protein n=1 Tax=Clonostachys solani TaxID=160281 RepID=A0A9N9YV21_9HYPO|nr:unnamed protein product [Clonostachys solani]